MAIEKGFKLGDFTIWLIFIFGLFAIFVFAQVWSILDEAKGVAYFQSSTNNAIEDALLEKYTKGEIEDFITSRERPANRLRDIMSAQGKNQRKTVIDRRGEVLDAIRWFVGYGVPSNFTTVIEEAESRFENSKNALWLRKLSIKEYCEKLFEYQDSEEVTLRSRYKKKGSARSEWRNLLSKGGLNLLDALGRGSIFGVLVATIGAIVSSEPESFIQSDWFVYAPVFGALLSVIVYYYFMSKIFWKFNKDLKDRVWFGVSIFIIVVMVIGFSYALLES
ncbi:hypothetical protein AAFL42_10480 [Corynebacterium amycolatum]|uniref:hypothetical protein n=1 Tax=Corynebacterium amycolatum TaxID=43765 RepID=UPI0031680A6D